MNTDNLIALAEEADRHLGGPDQATWLRRLEAERPRFEAALEECRHWAQLTSGLRLCVALGRYWWMCGHARLGRHWIDFYLQWAPSDFALFGRGLMAAGGLAYALADYPAAREWLEEALYQHFADDRHPEHPAILNQLGMIDREQGNYARSRHLHQQAMRIYALAGNDAGCAGCVSNLGVANFFAGEVALARGLHEDALRRRRALADERGIASSLGNLANVARHEGDPQRAQEGHEQALAIRQRLGDRWGIAGSLLNLSLVALDRGNLTRARDLLSQAEAGFLQVDDALGACECLDARALLLARERSPEALAAFEEAEKARQAIGAPMPAVYRPELERVKQALTA